MNEEQRTIQRTDVDELWLQEWAGEGIAELERRLAAREEQIGRYAARGITRIERSLALHAAFDRYVYVADSERP